MDFRNLEYAWLLATISDVRPFFQIHISQLFRSIEFGNGSRISDEKSVILQAEQKMIGWGGAQWVSGAQWVYIDERSISPNLVMAIF